MSKRYLILLYLTFLGLSTSTWAYDFVIKDPSCKLRWDKLGHQDLDQHMKDALVKKGYTPIPFAKRGRLFANDLYLKHEIKRLAERDVVKRRVTKGVLSEKKTGTKKLLYKICQFSFSLQKAKSTVPTSKDPLLVQKETQRSVPRVTFDGDERCQRAISDAFVHLPRCLKVNLE